MEIQELVETKSFLGMCGGPYKSMCRCAPLKTGVIIIGVIDIMYGFFFGGGLVYLLLHIIDSQLISIIDIQFIWRYSISVITMPFAIIGLAGIHSENIKHVSLYSNYKIIEYFLLIFFEVQIIRDDYLFQYVGIKITTLIFAKIIWSAKIRLMYNQAILVKYGEEAYIRAQQQGIDLANVNAILPGMSINYMARSSDMQV